MHGLAQTWVQIGRNPISGLSKIAPHIGSVVAIELGSQSQNRLLPAFVSLNTQSGPDQGYLPPENGPFYVSPNGGGLTNTKHPDGAAALDRRMRTASNIGPSADKYATFSASARRMIYNSDIGNVFNFNQTRRNAYGNTSFGNACLTAHNLIRSDLGTRFVQITFGSWDHHSNIYAPKANLQAMATQFDNGMGPLNTNNGRDHHLQQSVMVAGARVSGGREIKPEDLEATIYSAMGIDWTTVRYDDPFKRGFEYVPKTDRFQYAPVNELWS